MPQQPVSFPVGGGLDLVTPALAMKPGRVIAALNYAPVGSGYQRLRGIERFDGRPSPSAATYWRIDYSAGDNNGVEPTVGQAIRDSTASGSVHIVGFIVAVVTTSGSWATDDAAGYFIATNMTHDFTGTTGYFSTAPAPLRSFNCSAQALEYDFTGQAEVWTQPEFDDDTGLTLQNCAVSNGVAAFSGTDTGTSGVPGLCRAACGAGTFTLNQLWHVEGYCSSFSGVPGVVALASTTGGNGSVLANLITGVGPFSGHVWITSIASSSFALLKQDSGTMVIDRLSISLAGNQDAIAAAREVTRAKILQPAGEGPVRGIWAYNGNILAFRDNVGATAGVMFKASAAGWVAAPALTRIDFTCDTATQTMPLTKPPAPPTAPQDVANVSGGTTDGTIRSVSIVSTAGTVNTCFMFVSGYNPGSWTAAGQTIYQAGTATQFGTTTAAASTPVIAAGGRWHFVNHNFYGLANFSAVYAANGTGQGIVYDGVGFANISTGVAVDKPFRVTVQKQSLFLAMLGGASVFSVVGQPTVYNGVLGAGEIDIGNEIADYLVIQGALAILGTESISVLYGNDSGDYQLEVLNAQAGALPFTAQWMGQGIYMDNRGIRSLGATAAYGNFSFGTMSRMIEPLLTDLRRDGVNPVLSLVLRSKDQYWLFFDNKTGIILYTGKKDPEILPFKLPVQVTCGCSVEDDGVERAFIGCDDGFVYEFEKGFDFDGAALEHYLRFAFNHFGSPRLFKRYHKVGVDLEASGPVTLFISGDLDLGSAPGIVAQRLTLTTGGGAIDSLGSNELYFASQIETLAEAYLGAVGKNLSLKISGSTIGEEPHTVTGFTFHVSVRGMER